MNKNLFGEKFCWWKKCFGHYCHYCPYYHIGRYIGTFVLPFDTLKVTFSQRSRTDGRTNRLTNRQLDFESCSGQLFVWYPITWHKILQGLPPGRILYWKIPVVFHNGPTSNHRAGLILRWDQLQSEASRFTALTEAALYTTTFSRDFQALKGRVSCLWLAGTNLRESLRVDNNMWRQSIKCK